MKHYEKIEKFELTQKVHCYPAGTQVYISHSPSYGLCGEDERASGVGHVLVNAQSPLEDQRYGNFTCPISALRSIEETNTFILKKLAEISDVKQKVFDKVFEKLVSFLHSDKAVIRNYHRGVISFSRIILTDQQVKGLYDYLSFEDLKHVDEFSFLEIQLPEIECIKLHSSFYPNGFIELHKKETPLKLVINYTGSGFDGYGYMSLTVPLVNNKYSFIQLPTQDVAEI